MTTFVLVAALAAELYFLLGDLSPGRGPASRSGPSAPPIAELVSRQNEVKVRGEGELVWEETSARQTLLRRQSLLTLEGSRAEVAFLDGTGLMIDEKSLILLEKVPADDSGGYERIVVRLLHGTVRKSEPRKSSDLLRRVSAKTPELEIDAGDTKIQVSPTTELTVTSLQDDPEGPRVMVQSGEARAETPHGSIVVKQGEEATLPKAGSAAAPVTRKLPFSLLSPQPEQVIEALAGDQPVRFRWNTAREVAQGHPQEIEVSRDPEFKSGITRTRIPAAEPPLEYVEINVTVPAQSGAARWYWRVKTVDQGPQPAALSEPSSFWIRPQSIPQLRYPVDQAQAPAESTVDFAWEPLDNASSYELEIEGRATVQTQDSFAQIRQLSPGTRHWRVRARLADGNFTDWSPARTLVIRDLPAAEPSSAASTLAPPSGVSTQPAPSGAPAAAAAPAATAAPAPGPADAPPPPPDELDEPEIRPAPAPAHTSVWDLFITPALAAEDSWIVHLKWHAVPGVARYKIQVAKDKNFKNVVSESESSQAEWDWNFKLGMQNRQGRVYFRVASVSASGVAGAYSRGKPIKIPRSILVSVSVKKDVYAAKDNSPGAEAIEGVDAAERSDLQDLAAKPEAPSKPALSKDLAGPRVGPPALGPRTQALREGMTGVSSDSRKTPEAALAAKPAPPVAATTSAPSAPATSAPAAPGTPAESVAQVTPPGVSPWSWNIKALLGTGLGDMTQSTGAPDLNSVTPQSPYLQQKFSLEAQLANADSATAWLAAMELWMAGFQAPDNNAAQASFKAYGFRLDVVRDWGFSWARFSGSLRFFFGATIDHSYRWVLASGGQSVDSQGALSLGPSARAVRIYHYTGALFSMKETGAALELPATGLLTSGQAGADIRIWGEWNLASFKQNAFVLSARAEAEASYLRWASPSGTSTFAWAFWLAPAFGF